MAIIGIFLDRRVSVDLAPAIKRYFTSDLYRGLGEKK
jgi:hypothetical protein